MPRTGYGLSAMAADLRGLLDRAGIAKADIVGHSFGGRVALAFAVEHGERVRNLVVADTRFAGCRRRRCGCATGRIGRAGGRSCNRSGWKIRRATIPSSITSCWRS